MVGQTGFTKESAQVCDNVFHFKNKLSERTRKKIAELVIIILLSN